MKRPVSLLYCSDSVFFGGDTRQEYETLRTLNPEAYRVTALVPPHGPTHDAVTGIPGVRAIVADFGTKESKIPTRTGRALSFLSSLSLLLRTVRQVRPEALLVGDRTRPVLAALLVRRFSKCKIVYLPGFFYIPGEDRGGIKRRLATVAEVTMVHTEHSRETYLRAGAPNDRVIVVRYGIETDRFEAKRNTQKRAELGFTDSEVVVGICGVIREFKGHEMLVAAMADARKRDPRLRLLVVGDGHLRAPVENRVREAELEPFVRFVGFQTQTAPFYQCMDIYAMASDEEPFGLVTVEAMASGLPVVGTNSGGTPEIVLPGVTGLLVPPQDPGAMAEGILQLAASATLRTEWGLRGQQRVREMYYSERRAVAVANLFEKLFHGTPSHGPALSTGF
ncbi:MAG: glycosyltransferase family 4 protein [Capsulimonadales bacterium]|nr:glycosyltransferase family 4 protein [Capsulimonadales bacterium]